MASLLYGLTYRAGGIVQGNDELPTLTPLPGIIGISVAFPCDEGILDIQKQKQKTTLYCIFQLKI